jgi:hypothetical protein
MVKVFRYLEHLLTLSSFSLKAYLVRIRGDPADEVRERLKKVKAEMKNEDIHMYMNL